jgi:hypothetical protein
MTRELANRTEAAHIREAAGRCLRQAYRQAWTTCTIGEGEAADGVSSDKQAGGTRQ